MDFHAKCLKVAEEAARAAGDIQLRYFREGGFSTDHKGRTDLVTTADIECEKTIVSIIRNNFPDHAVLAEEGTAGSAPENLAGAGYKWVIDPLDGTTNFSHGFPYFCASVGLEHAGAIVAGAVFNPMLGEMFTGLDGGGAFLNGAPVKVSSAKNLVDSLLCTGFPYDIRENRNNNLDHFCNFAVRAQALRRTGAAALDICYTAMGRFDGFWEARLKPWDSAAARVILAESGGKVTHFDGSAFSIYREDIVASNGLIHGAMLEVLALAGGG